MYPALCMLSIRCSYTIYMYMIAYNLVAEFEDGRESKLGAALFEEGGHTGSEEFHD
jgi:hypothetical protein